jgi:hypothetical protein
VTRRRLFKTPKPITREEESNMIPLRDLGNAAGSISDNAALPQPQINDPNSISVLPSNISTLPNIREEDETD